MHGTALASHWSETGLTVSGVEDASTRSTPSWLMSSAAASPARWASDALSLTRISTPCSTPPMVSGFSAKCASIWSSTNASASPKAASGPVCGVT